MYRERNGECLAERMDDSGMRNGGCLAGGIEKSVRMNGGYLVGEKNDIWKEEMRISGERNEVCLARRMEDVW